MTPIEHARRTIDNYVSHGIGDPSKSDDPAVAMAVEIVRAYNQRDDAAFDAAMAALIQERDKLLASVESLKERYAQAMEQHGFTREQI